MISAHGFEGVQYRPDGVEDRLNIRRLRVSQISFVPHEVGDRGVEEDTPLKGTPVWFFNLWSMVLHTPTGESVVITMCPSKYFDTCHKYGQESRGVIDVQFRSGTLHSCGGDVKITLQQEVEAKTIIDLLRKDGFAEYMVDAWGVASRPWMFLACQHLSTRGWAPKEEFMAAMKAMTRYWPQNEPVSLKHDVGIFYGHINHAKNLPEVLP